MAIFGNKKLIATREELPIVNGRSIHAIYGRMETAYYEKGRLLEDAYNEKPDYYLLCTEDSDYKKDKNGNYNFVRKSNIETRELPAELAQLFGKQKSGNYSLYVTRMWIRTSCSGNGSFTDSLCSLEGGCGAEHKSINYYREKRWKDCTNESATFIGEEYAKKIDSILGKKFTVEELPAEFNVEFPCSYIRNVGGLNYPDTKCSGWRWSQGDPYVSNAFDHRGNPDRTNIRVYLEKLNAHLYLEKVIEVEAGDEGLIDVNFSRSYDKNPNQFCRVSTWSDSKKEDPNGIIRWNVLSKNKKGEIEVGAMINDKVQFKRDGGNFYRLNRLVFID